MVVQPYVFFDGKCDEAIEFYKRAAGAKVEMLMRFKDGPPQDPANCPGGKAPAGDKVMHGQLTIGDSTLLVSDGNAVGAPKFDGFSLAVSCKTAAEVDKLFAGLSEGGTVVVPAAKTFFSEKFGMLSDKFGVMWMILVQSH